MPDRIKIAAVRMERELMKTGENLPTELVTLRNRVLTQLRNCAIVIKRGVELCRLSVLPTRRVE